MSAEAQIAAFEDGRLRLLSSSSASREAVLALPLSRLLVKMVRVPAGSDAVEFATPILKSLSPYPDEPLTVSCEKVREDADGAVVIAAAFPESSADDVGEALDAAKLNVVRIDLLALGQLRGIWSALGESSDRRLVLLCSPDCVSVVVLDGEHPSAIRAITDTESIRRELVLSLLEAEDFGGPRKLAEIVVVEQAAAEPESGDVVAASSGWADSLADLAPVRRIEVGSDAALVGVAARANDEGALNALPGSWRDLLDETRFKRKLVKCLAIAGGIWLLVVAIMFGVPMGYGFMVDRQKSLSQRHARQYKAVKEMRAKVDLIGKYSDHARGALEIMKALSDRLPEGVTLSSWSYKREDGVRVEGDADTAEAVYAFKDAMDELSAGEGGERLFGTVGLTGPSASKGRHHFKLACQYQEEGDE